MKGLRTLGSKFPHFLSASLLVGLAPLALSQDSASPGETPEGLEPGDWSSIRAAYDAGRHKAFATESGFRAHNPGQGWQTQFDGQGFLVQPDDGDWSWGLQFEAYGFAGAMQKVLDSGVATAAGNRVAYDWDGNVQEWYVNDTRGLEHGFTVERRPDGGANEDSRLSFNMAVRGGLKAQVLGDGLGVRFLNTEGSSVLTYAGLHVFDADGVAQSAHFVGAGNQLSITIAESGARYPLTIDPVAQQAYLKASNTDAGDEFGSSVAISGNLVVVGAGSESSNATGINGDQSDDSAVRSGAAYVFERSGGVWSQQAYLKASNTGSGDSFGYSVAISGDLVVVGAYQEYSNATGVNNGDQSDNSAVRAGAAYVFERIGGVWSQQAYLKASNTNGSDTFGRSVAISGDLIVVGASGERSNATSVNGDQSDNSAFDAGAAYVFERIGGVWSQQAYLKTSNMGAGDFFGDSVAISGDLVVVGARGEASNATGVNGDQSNNGAPIAGAAYVFERSGGAWSQRAYLKASNTDTGDFFGQSVAISGGLVVVGAHGEASNTTGVNPGQNDNSAQRAGAAYVFERSGGVWSQQAYLKASNADDSDYFGLSVAISGDLVVVGAFREDSNATGVNGDQSDESAVRAGAAYLFERTGGVWRDRGYLKASNTGAFDSFGVSVAISGVLVVVGASGEDGNATGVNGDQSDNSAAFAGAAYIFEVEIDSSIGMAYCSPNVVNSTGLPASLVANGSTVVANNDVTLTVSDLPPNVFGLFFTGRTQGFVPFPGGSQGNLCLSGSIGRYNGPGQLQSSGPGGSISLPLDLTQTPHSSGLVPIMAGETWNFQVWYRDNVGGVSTSNLSDAVEITFQ